MRYIGFPIMFMAIFLGALGLVAGSIWLGFNFPIWLGAPERSLLWSVLGVFVVWFAALGIGVGIAAARDLSEERPITNPKRDKPVNAESVIQ